MLERLLGIDFKSLSTGEKLDIIKGIEDELFTAIKQKASTRYIDTLQLLYQQISV